MKIGLQTVRGGFTELGGQPDYNIEYVFNNRRPVSLQYVLFPHVERTTLLNLAVYAQDQWTIRRMTLNYGLRLDHLNATIPAQVIPAGEFSSERRFDEVKNVPNWWDINPRMGAAYDLFGNGKTALKVAVGRYINPETSNVAGSNNPSNTIASNTTRTWNVNSFPAGDPRNGNYVPDCDLHDPATNGECGPFSNRNFGTTVVNTRWDDAILRGWAVRPYNWQMTAAVQQELRPGVGLTVGYFRTWYGNFTVTDNLLLTPEDFDPYCVTAPVDPRLPDGGGQQICGYYDLKRAKVGPTSNVVTRMSNYGDRSQVYNGVDIGMHARFGKGGLLSGGVSLGNTRSENCVVVDSPQQTLFCEMDNPQNQVKISGAYPLPWWGLQASAVFQNVPGVALNTTYAAPNAVILPTLGRNLGACGASATCTTTQVVPLMESNTVFESRQTQVDFRLSKTLQFRRIRLRPRLDVYNLFNANSATGVNTRYTPTTTYLRPNGILAGRFFKFGTQVEF